MKPFTGNGFGSKIRVWCEDAGLPNCSSHGLRKAIGRRLAEAGTTEHEIAAILGVSLRTAAIYTAAADKVHLAGAGMAKLSD